jgi:hypothetical protein
MFPDVSEVFAVCITMSVMNATSTPETPVYFYRIHSGATQKAAIFIVFLIGPEMHKF